MKYKISMNLQENAFDYVLCIHDGEMLSKLQIYVNIYLFVIKSYGGISLWHI